MPTEGTIRGVGVNVDWSQHRCSTVTEPARAKAGSTFLKRLASLHQVLHSKSLCFRFGRNRTGFLE